MTNEQIIAELKSKLDEHMKCLECGGAAFSEEEMVKEKHTIVYTRNNVLSLIPEALDKARASGECKGHHTLGWKDGFNSGRKEGISISLTEISKLRADKARLEIKLEEKDAEIENLKLELKTKQVAIQKADEKVVEWQRECIKHDTEKQEQVRKLKEWMMENFIIAFERAEKDKIFDEIFPDCKEK